MPVCFVIQPFDGAKFDKRFTDVFAPAIEAAKMEPYRVDRDPGVDVAIDAIEEGIRNADACLADITTDNPNVWYELGFASAIGKLLVMVCSDERKGKKYPFDIQHRTILPYSVDSTSDFEGLKRRITERLLALLAKRATLDQIGSDRTLSNVEGLSQPELIVLAAAAGNAFAPSDSAITSSVRNDVLGSGFTLLAFALGMKRLVGKGLIRHDFERDEDGESWSVIVVTDCGWSWIDKNEDKFVLRLPKDDIPF